MAGAFITRSRAGSYSERCQAALSEISSRWPTAFASRSSMSIVGIRPPPSMRYGTLPVTRLWAVVNVNTSRLDSN